MKREMLHQLPSHSISVLYSFNAGILWRKLPLIRWRRDWSYLKRHSHLSNVYRYHDGVYRFQPFSTCTFSCFSAGYKTLDPTRTMRSPPVPQTIWYSIKNAQNSICWKLNFMTLRHDSTTSIHIKISLMQPVEVEFSSTCSVLLSPLFSLFVVHSIACSP